MTSMHPRRRVRSLPPGLGFLIAGMVAVVLFLLVMVPVPQNREALVLRMGRPVRVLNGWGDQGAGLAMRWPVLEQVVWVERRQMAVPLDAAPVTTSDGQPLVVDAYAAVRVVDPARLYLALGSADHVPELLRPVLASVVQREVGRRSFAGAMALARGEGLAPLRAAFDREARVYGLAVADVRLRRLAMPEGAALEAVYARMSASREADAAAIAAQAHKDAETIRADAQALAARTYAESFGKDPQFYDFYRAMQSYDTTFAQKGSRTAIVLSPDSAYLRQFRGDSSFKPHSGE